MGFSAGFKISAKSDLPIILVAGGAGFLGSHLCRWLLKKKTQVICVDDFRTSEKKSIADLLKDKNFLLLEKDLDEPLNQFEKLDYIFHLAGFEEHYDEKETKISILEVNSLGTRNLLELARQTKAKFLFTSSTKVFSNYNFSTKIDENLAEQPKSFVYHEGKRFSEFLIAEYFRQYKLNCRIVCLIDVYGPGMNMEVNTPISRLISAAKNASPLVIEGDGLDAVYPTYIDDAIEGIIRATFLSNTIGKIYNLVGPKITLLKFAENLREISGKNAEIVFKKEQELETKLYFPPDFKKTQSELGWEPKTFLEEGLKRTLGISKQQEIDSNEEPEITVKEEKSVDNFSGKELVEEEKRVFLKPFQKIILAFFLLGLLILIPFLSLGWDIFWAEKNLMALEKKTALLNPRVSWPKAKEAEKHFSQAQKKLTNLNWILTLAHQEKEAVKWQEKLTLGAKIAGGAEEVTRTMVILEKTVGDVLSEKQIEKKEIEQAKIALADAQEKWGEAEAKLKTSDEEKERTWGQQLTQYRNDLREGEQWLALFEKMIAFDGAKTYLLLLQNNMEIRPTGGFIGSFGLLTFENGKLQELKIEDVYTADGQLKGHVEPPEAIKKYLGKEHWFLRDANWDPDFPKSAQKTEWFLEKELGIKTDGVLAFDLNMAKYFIETLGPLELVDYQEKITSQNLFEKTEKYSEENFFPGSTQKGDFLGSLAKALLEKMKGENGKWFELGKVAMAVLDERHLSFYFNDLELEQKVLQKKWGGSIENTPCLTEKDCLGDYLMIVDANLGVNKVNYWVKKEIKDKISIDSQGKLTHKLTLDYQNDSSPDSWAGGVYKNYLRIYTPLDTVFDNLQIDGVATESAEVASASGKAILGFLIEVSPESKKEVVVSYTLPQRFSSPKSTYQLLLQKQLGSQTEPFSVEINYPSSWQMEKGDLSSLTTRGEIKYNSPELDKLKGQYQGDLKFDQKLEIEFEK